VFEVGEQGIAPLKAPPWSGKAHREVPFWRRPATMVIEIAVVLVLVALPLWYLVRPEPAIAFAQRDWVVVGDLKNLTDESSFDDSLEEAFRIGLEQSRYVNVLSDLKARDTVKLMQRPEQTKVDRAIGSEVAIRNGARALILPTVAEIGGRVRVTAEVIDPHTQTTVWSESADGTGAASVLPSLDKVNQKLRVRLGEALATVSNESQPLDKVATKNLDALRAYSLGERAYSSNADEAMQLFRQALKLDPQFALAHVSIARLLTNDSQDDAAIKELDLALALREHLPPRDALYVEALRETFGPPRPALEKWKLLANLYPDFFPGQGAYGYFSWELANRYTQAIPSAKLGASPQNAHRAASQYLLGTLYLGNEQYADALREFDEFNAVPGTPVGFHAAAYAAQRRYDKSEALLASTRREPTDVTIGTARAIHALDQGKWSEGRDIIRTLKSQPKLAAAESRQLNSIELGLGAIEAKATPAFSKAAHDVLKGERDMQPPPVSQAARSDSEFRILLAAYLAAKADDVEGARTILSSAGSLTRDPDYPILLNMRDVAESELARAERRPDDAIKTLTQRKDGTELYVTHVALMDAYSASGKLSEALSEAEWLASHRGRAYTEYGAEWVMTAFNVVQSDLALLRASELARSLGQTERARQWRDQFVSAWPGASKVSFVAPRLADETHPKP
jgi:putative peptide modification system cyclase